MSRIRSAFGAGLVAVAAVGLAGCDGSAGNAPPGQGPTIPPSPSSPHVISRTPTLSPHQQMLHDYPDQCGGRWDRWKLVQASSATTAGGVVRVVGHPGFVRCGGPSDIAYLHRGKVETLTLAAGVVVRVVNGEPTDPPTRLLSTAELRGYLQRHQWSNFFRYAGPRDAVTKLIELYHP